MTVEGLILSGIVRDDDQIILRLPYRDARTCKGHWYEDCIIGHTSREILCFSWLEGSGFVVVLKEE